MKQFMALCLGMILLTACKHHDDEPSIFDRTILIYVAGDNSLTKNNNGYDFANADIAQMIQGSKKVGSNNKLLLFVDKRNNTSAQKELPYFLLIENGDTTRLQTMDSEVKTSDAEVLQKAMKWATTHYEAKSYGLVLWGHNEGWIMRNSHATSRSPRHAYGIDQTGGDTWMDITDMAKALATLPHLTFIFADCCAFQCVECAYELRNCTDYIIASAAEIPGEGAPYHTIVPLMFSQDEQFYEHIADAYYAQTFYGFKEPMAVVRTSRLDNLAQATYTTLASFLPQMEDGGRYPDVDSLIYYFDHTQFDMNDFMLRYADSNQYNAWKQAFDQAVVYKTWVPVWMANHVHYRSYWDQSAFYDFEVEEHRYGGLGMFIPQDPFKSIGYYSISFSIAQLNKDIKLMQWYKAARLDELGW